ncbi:MAG: phosphate/phosphite/phosphonate ABC transporter substrate-binding protein [Desulfobacterales bacterium]|nr:phosphate/phosphite/phosphonate ABC transporter substrate-binding protein [Desulfobacterales bacterium]
MSLNILSKQLRWISLVLGALLLFLSFPAQPRAGEKIVIGLLPEMNVFKQKRRFEPLAAYLTKKIGVKVQLTILSRYGNIIQRFIDHRVDGAFLGSFTGALAISQLKVEPLARPVNLDGTSTYCGYIFVRKDSGIKNVADMKNKTLALVERATTAGFVFPIAYLKRDGINDFTSYFKDYFFTGSHDASIKAVLAGEADVGAAKNTIYERTKQSDPRVAKDLVILATSIRVPSNGLCVRADMKQDLKERLKAALLNLDQDPAGVSVLKSLGAVRFVKTGKDDYQPVFDLAEEAGLQLKEYHYKNQ